MLTIATYGRSVYRLSLNQPQANAGALEAVSGSSVWAGPILLAGDTTISADGTQAVSLDFARLHRLRPGYGYASYSERFADDPAPAQLGIWWVDTTTGKNDLVITLKQLAAFQPDAVYRAHSTCSIFGSPSKSMNSRLRVIGLSSCNVSAKASRARCKSTAR